MASAMASLALPSALSTASSRLAQPQQVQQMQQSMLVVRNSASAERPCSASTGKDSALQFTSRRQAALSLAGLSLALLTGSGSRAEASDVPFFGLKRKLEDAEKAVVEEVKELVLEGEAEVSAVSSAVAGAFKSSSAEGGLSPAVQAGLVAGAELVAVVAASSVVSSLVSQPSK